MASKALKNAGGAAGYVLKSTVFLTQIESVKNNISGSIGRIKELSEGNEKLPDDVTDYEAIINREVSIRIILALQKKLASKGRDLKSIVDDPEKNKNDIISLREQYAELYPSHRKEIEDSIVGLVIGWQKTSFYMFLTSFIVLTASVGWFLFGYYTAIFGLPAVALSYVLSLKYAFLAETYRSKEVFTLKEFLNRKGFFSWALI